MTIFTDVMRARKLANISTVQIVPTLNAIPHMKLIKRMTMTLTPNLTLTDASLGLAHCSVNIGGSDYPCYGGPTDASASGSNTFIHEPPQPIRIPDSMSVTLSPFTEAGVADPGSYGDFVLKIIYELE